MALFYFLKTKIANRRARRIRAVFDRYYRTLPWLARAHANGFLDEASRKEEELYAAA